MKIIFSGNPPFWVDPSNTPDGKDNLAKSAFSKALVVSTYKKLVCA
jgi:hypothetical protein